MSTKSNKSQTVRNYNLSHFSNEYNRFSLDQFLKDKLNMYVVFKLHKIKLFTTVCIE